jgi:LacI family transcriptional regulator
VERENFLCRTLPFTFNAKQARAVICIEMFDRAYDEMVCTLGLPVLFVDGPHKRDGIDLPADQLYMDNTTAITRFVNDMLVRGKRRIGFIGDYEHCQSFFERYTAFRCAMLMAGVPVDERFCIKVLNPEQLTNTLVSMKEFPEVFICANDFVADDAIYVLRKLGKSVPEDVLFCGFDDSPQSRIMTPSLTTVHIHTQIMAFTAMQLLLSRIDQPSLDYRTVHTETELIYRDSTKL